MNSSKPTLDSNQISVSLDRVFPNATIDRLQNLMKLERLDDPTYNQDLVDTVQQIRSLSSYFGCPAVAKHARDLLGLSNASSSGRQAAIFEGLQILESLVAHPDDPELISKSDTWRANLQSTPSSVPEQFRSITTSADQSTEQWDQRSDEEASHNDQYIYANDTIDGLEHCVEEETWTVTQLAAAVEDIASTVDEFKPAHRLMKVLAGHHFFQNVDRICVVGLVPGTNHLCVIDSALSSKLREQGVRNQMVRGYSCFVDPNGSLAQMKPGVLRVFGDSQAVLRAFARGGRPAQRSIAYVAESGLRSGVCLAIGRGEGVQGFLFLNSVQPNLFAGIREKYGALLSLFSLLGTVALDAAGFHPSDPASQLASKVPSKSLLFNAGNFETAMRAAASEQLSADVRVEVAGEIRSEFLFNPQVVCNGLATLAGKFGIVTIGGSEAICVDVNAQHDHVALTIRRPNGHNPTLSNAWAQRQVDLWNHEHKYWPVSAEIANGSFALRFPFEPAFQANEEVRYSVAF